MFKRNFFLGTNLLSILLVSLAISGFNNWTYPSHHRPQTDFYQRHPDWVWVIPEAKAAASDDLQRLLALTTPEIQRHDASNYFLRLS